MAHNKDNDAARMLDFLLGVLKPAEAAEMQAEFDPDAVLRDRLAPLSTGLEAARRGLDLAPARGTRRALLEAVTGGYQSYWPRVSAFLDLDERQTRNILKLAAAPPQRWADRREAGVWTQPLEAGPRHRDASAFLLRLEPEAEISRHRHLGAEWGFILGGQLSDDGGELSSAGDIVFKAAGSSHRVWNPGTHPAVAINVVYGGYDWAFRR